MAKFEDQQFEVKLENKKENDQGCSSIEIFSTWPPRKKYFNIFKLRYLDRELIFFVDFFFGTRVKSP